MHGLLTDCQTDVIGHNTELSVQCCPGHEATELWWFQHDVADPTVPPMASSLAYKNMSLLHRRGRDKISEDRVWLSCDNGLKPVSL
jgi:hypothetical protein